MTSSNSIVIDWSSSSSTHSFIRIDDPSFSQNNSLYPTPDFDSRTSLNNNNDGNPIKDFSHISSISLTTTPPNVDNSFLISFKKFHVTKIHFAGYNKIYAFRRSKSFFFEIADHHLDTNQLHLRIHTNDYFMSTTPIKYHSTSALPNTKYQISKGLQHFFSSQKVIPRQVIKPGAVSSTSTKLAAAKKGRFLFLPSQKFTTPLKHLRYKKTVDIPIQKDYNFTIPHYFGVNRNTTIRSKALCNISIVTATTSASVPNNEILYTVAPYNPTPDMFIPIKYRDIIPPDPIYDNLGSFIVPGSREWFTYMYQLDLDTRDDRLRKADDAKFTAYIDELTAEGEASRARYQQRLDEHSKEITELILQEETRIHDLAIYHGTSSKHIKHRQRQASVLTRWNDDCHTNMILSK
ncbi:hypothetical protein RhiirC2_856548 [Rhizophagus irregularis]|uniref:DUF8211 domain-containing protein n=1 Tax=Rhizophagus irregularis TaxID=588596 RepID=A0A2N1MH41_9GLOM|nr:hypothetical protein RhiirC2_856548 [Rhizophagus irregularis]